MNIFEPNLLEGRSIALAGPVPRPVHELLEALGARTYKGQEPVAPLDVVVCAAKTPTGLIAEALLEPEWTAVHAIATEIFIPAKSGRIALIAPREDAGVLAAALENLARTLSVEWARYGITTTAIAPGPDTSDGQLAAVTAYLCSEAGAYFSGCRLDMR